MSQARTAYSQAFSDFDRHLREASGAFDEMRAARQTERVSAEAYARLDADDAIERHALIQRLIRIPAPGNSTGEQGRNLVRPLPEDLDRVLGRTDPGSTRRGPPLDR